MASRGSALSKVSQASLGKGPSMMGAYLFVTAAYWSFMLSDGALRMLVLLRFHQQGYGPLQLASLFVLYEAMGVVTNLFAGWMAARVGFRATLIAGLGVQIIALLLLSIVPLDGAFAASLLAVALIQGLAGIAKDLTKTSAKSAVKLLVPEDARQGQGGALFTWVARLTGAKNTIKGMGFFAGAALLALVGYTLGLWIMAGVLTLVLLGTIALMPDGLPRGKPVPFANLFKTNPKVARLSLARLFLFASRDAWFVVAMPIFMTTSVQGLWGLSPQTSFFVTGGFMALWVMAYGMVQATAPAWLGDARKDAPSAAKAAIRQGVILAGILAVAAIVMAMVSPNTQPIGATGAIGLVALVGILLGFGAVFALNSSLHSFLILAFSDQDRVSQDVGIYYMSNAVGRLLGTLLSGAAYLWGGIVVALVVAALSALIAALCMLGPDDD